MRTRFPVVSFIGTVRSINLNLDGVDYWLSAWIKEGKNGKFMGLAVNPKDAQPPASNPRKAVIDDSDIPF